MVEEPGTVRRPEGGRGRAPRFSPAWLQRANTTLIILLLLGAMGFGFRALSMRAAEELPVPGIYVKVRAEGGGVAEARASPVPSRQAPGPTLTLEATLVDVASLVRLIEEETKTRIVLSGPVEQRVSLRVRNAPVEAALEAVAAAANLALTQRDGAYLLRAPGPPDG